MYVRSKHNQEENIFTIQWGSRLLKRSKWPMDEKGLKERFSWMCF